MTVHVQYNIKLNLILFYFLAPYIKIDMNPVIVR